MIAEVLREDIPSVELDDTLQRSLDIINANEVTEVSVTDRNKFLHILREIDLLTSDAWKMSDLNGDQEGAFIFRDDHFFQALIKINNLDLSLIPVVNREMEYMGAITKRKIEDYICDSYSVGSEGSIIIIEQALRDYSLATIANATEQEGAKILGLFINPAENNLEKIWISIKLNTLESGRIISALERHGLDVIAQIDNEYKGDGIKERYESFMTFLNV